MSDIILNSKLAEAVCATITLGFIKNSLDKTTFIYMRDSEDGGTLNDFLKDKVFGRSILIQKTEDDALSECWITSAKKNYVQNTDYKERAYFNQLCNKHKLSVFYGAYIGGGLDENTGEVRFIGGSNIYLYEKDQTQSQFSIERTQDQIKETVNSYSNARSTSKEILKMLQSICNKNESTQHFKLESDIEALNTLVSRELKSNEYYASVHGLVKAILYFKNSEKITPIEHALSRDTVKIGSCIPCSIFASSQNSIVNYTHLGRGDSWNFPINDPKFNYNLNNIKQTFFKHVTNCFNEGINIITEKKLPINKDLWETIIKIQSKNNSTVVGNIFLYSLTFESSFTNKILHTFNISTTNLKHTN